MPGAAAVVERVFREEYGRLIASLVRRFGDIDIAEEAAGEALVAALERWPESGVPPNPGGWLTVTAGNRAIDRLRREQLRDAKHRAALVHEDPAPPAPRGPVEDDRLRLLFTCCHPALAPEARIALTLRLLGGLTVAETAQAFLVPETTMAQRITRAKKKIAAAKVPYRVPEAADLPERLDAVLVVLFLVFNEGYLTTGDGDPVRGDLTREAIRLTRLLRLLLPQEPEVVGLLGLLLLTEARRGARVRDEQLVPLGEQDRAGWDRALIAEGHDLVRSCLQVNRPGRYQILAAINAVHTDAPAASETDWSQVVALYDQLTRFDPSPVVALNRAVAIAELDGPTAALELVDRLPLVGYHAWHATRADLLRRLDRTTEALESYDAAIAATQNRAERAYLHAKRDEVGARRSPFRAGSAGGRIGGGRCVMAAVRKGRFTADTGSLGDDVVVFLIGMRINRPWRVRAWWPVFVAMPTMLRYLDAHPEKGLLGYEQAFLPAPLIVQYWRSFEHLARFARDRDDPHLEPWREFNRRVAASGDVGIWHETYRVSTASIETIYANMPPYGLAAATDLVPIKRGRDSAAARIGAAATDEPALPPY